MDILPYTMLPDGTLEITEDVLRYRRLPIDCLVAACMGVSYDENLHADADVPLPGGEVDRMMSVRTYYELLKKAQLGLTPTLGGDERTSSERRVAVFHVHWVEDRHPSRFLMRTMVAFTHMLLDYVTEQGQGEAPVPVQLRINSDLRDSVARLCTLFRAGGGETTTTGNLEKLAKLYSAQTNLGEEGSLEVDVGEVDTSDL